MTWLAAALTQLIRYDHALTGTISGNGHIDRSGNGHIDREGEIRMVLVALALALQGVTLSNPDVPHHAHQVSVKVAVECSAFKANPNGSWTSIRSTKVGSVSMSAGGTFFPGVTIEGIDIGANLDQQCRNSHAG
jgi:hypothetical protein